MVDARHEALARPLEHVDRDVQPQLAELQHVRPVPVVADPPVPLVEVGLGIGAVLGEVLHHDRREDVDERVVDPERLLEVALDQRRVVIVLEDGQQRRVAVGDVPRLVGLHRQVGGRQREVAVARRHIGQRDEHDVRERRLRHDLQRERALDRIADDEVREHVQPRVRQHRARERLRPEVPAGGVGDVLGVPPRERHLHPRVADLVDELDVVAVAQLVVGNRAHQHRHAAAGADLGVVGDHDERLQDLQPPLVRLVRHVGADGGVEPAVDALVLLELHRQVLPHDVLHRVLGLVREPVAGRIADRWLVVGRLPPELRDARVGLGDAAAGQDVHRTPITPAAPRSRTTYVGRRICQHVTNGPGRPSGCLRRPPQPSAAAWVRSSTSVIGAVRRENPVYADVLGGPGGAGHPDGDRAGDQGVPRRGRARPASRAPKPARCGGGSGRPSSRPAAVSKRCGRRSGPARAPPGAGPPSSPPGPGSTPRP